MNETIDFFKNKKENDLLLLDEIKKFVKEGSKFGIEVDTNSIDKLENAFMETKNDKLKIVLIGGFSEGKTSIVAAWLEDFDKKTMKISNKESSDSIEIYKDNDFEIIDTPGLFGFKEKENNKKYEDITKEYLSNANLLFYVMNPSNPIKQTHIDTLKWLFKDLNLLSRTIFVISKFDEIADLEDEEEYLNELKIKQDNVKERLGDILELSSLEIDNISIVAVSADPFGKGIEYYIHNREEFRKLSHISTLQDATKNLIKKRGNREIVAQTKKTIVSDIVNLHIPKVKNLYNSFDLDIKQYDEMLTNISNELSNVKNKINQAKIGLRIFLIEYFSNDLIIKLNHTNMDGFNDFLNEEVGEEGINIENKILNEFEKYIESVKLIVSNINTEYKVQMRELDKSISSFAKNGLTFLKNSGIINSKNILSVRDLFGLSIKFKPWGAVKLAGNINKAIPFIGIAIEAWDSYSTHKKQQEFEKAKENMICNFNKQKQEYLNIVNSDEFESKFFPEYNHLKNVVQSIQKNKNEILQKQKDLEKWLKNNKDILDAKIID